MNTISYFLSQVSGQYYLFDSGTGARRWVWAWRKTKSQLSGHQQLSVWYLLPMLIWWHKNSFPLVTSILIIKGCHFPFFFCYSGFHGCFINEKFFPPLIALLYLEILHIIGDGNNGDMVLGETSIICSSFLQSHVSMRKCCNKGSLSVAWVQKNCIWTVESGSKTKGNNWV